LAFNPTYSSPNELAKHGLIFLKNFFSNDRSIDEKLIEATMAECNNDQEEAFERLISGRHTSHKQQDNH
jgi:hypothetical protein